MQKLRPLFLLLLSVWLGACASSNRPPQAVLPQDLSILPGQELVIQVNSGVVKLSGTEAAQVSVSGQLAAPERTTYRVSSEAGQVLIQAEVHKGLFSTLGDPVVELEVRVPQGTPVKVVTFDAAVTVRGLRGKVTVDSTSGEVLGEDLSGDITLRSERGNVRAVHCSGSLRVLGNYGILSIDNDRGDIGSSTIMGTIRYTGEPGVGDSIHLEVDHGPVEVTLGPASDLAISITSTSGDVTCQPGLEASTRWCRGVLGQGLGKLTVRTVSGGVTLKTK